MNRGTLDLRPDQQISCFVIDLITIYVKTLNCHVHQNKISWTVFLHIRICVSYLHLPYEDSASTELLISTAIYHSDTSIENPLSSLVTMGEGEDFLQIKVSKRFKA